MPSVFVNLMRLNSVLKHQIADAKYLPIGSTYPKLFKIESVNESCTLLISGGEKIVFRV